MHYVAAFNETLIGDKKFNDAKTQLWNMAHNLDRLHSELSAAAETVELRFRRFRESLAEGLLLDSPWASTTMMDMAVRREAFEQTLASLLTLARITMGQQAVDAFRREVNMRFESNRVSS